MKRLILLLCAAWLLLPALSPRALAQTTAPPRVVLFEREEIKPGRLVEHEREANNFARMLAHARTAGEPSYTRFGLTPVAGNANEVMYLYRFDSLEQWAQSQNDIERWMSRPGPMRAFYERLAGPPRPDAEDPHTSVRRMVGVYQPSMSYNPRPNLTKARYISMTTIRVKPGHYGDWMRLISMYVDAMKRMKGDPHFAAFEIVGGAPDGTFVFLTSMDSMAEMDRMTANAGEFPRAMGEKLDDFEKLVAASFESMTTNIYAINPRISNPPAEFVAADPAFWSHDMPTPAPAAPANRPAAARRRQR